MRIFVLLPHDMDPLSHKVAYLHGLAADASPWGFHLAEQFGHDVNFSYPLNDSGAKYLLRGASRKMLGTDLLHAYSFAQELRTHDVIFTHTEREYAAVSILRQVGLVSRQPKLVANTLWAVHEAKTSRYARGLLSFLLTQADLLTFNSKANFRAASEMFPRLKRKMFYVSFGISRESFPQAERGSAPARSTDVLVAGNDRARDWNTTAKVASLLPNKYFWVASRELPPELAHLANVKKLSCQGPRDMCNQYDAVGACLLLTHDNLHASGITVMLEAVNRGLPIVATRHGGLEDYFTSNEISFVTLGDADGAARALQWVTGPGRADAASMARRAAWLADQNDYSSRGFVGRLLEAINALDAEGEDAYGG